MRAFQNLSVARKLGVTAGLAMLLLTGLVGLVWSELNAVAQQQENLRGASHVLALVERAGAVASQAPVAAAELGTAQDLPAAEEAARKGREALASARSLTEEAASATTLPGAREATRSAIPATIAYEAAIDRMLEARSRMISARDDKLFRVNSDFDQAMEAVLGALEFEVSDRSQVEEVRSRVITFGNAVNDVRLAIQRFLITGEEAQMRRVRRAIAQQRVHLRGVQSYAVSNRLKEDLGRLGTLAAGLSEGAETILTTIADLATIRGEQAEPAAAALRTGLDEATRILREDEVAQRGSMDAALSGVEQFTLWIGGTVALILLASSWASARAIGAPLRRAAGRVRAIATGDTSPGDAAEAADRERHDETGRIAAALEDLRGTVGRAFAQAQMIEQMPLGLMAADPSLRVTHTNVEMGAVLARLGVVEPVLGRVLDELPLEGLAGLRATLSDPASLPHRVRLRMGAEVVDLQASAITDGSGAYAGPMLTWRLATEEARLADTFEAEVGAVVENLAGQVESLRRAAGEVHGTADRSGREAGQVADAAARASGEVGAVAAAAEEMAASITEITRRVAEAAEVAAQAVSEARATDGTVRGLSDSAARIGDVVRLIGDIAGQTNLLALNATIEAARAGEAGRGFAVVASEVKTLAAQTAKATEEISTQIQQMQAATSGAVEAIRGIGATVERTSGIATAIAAAVEQQGATTREIARSAAQVAGGTDTVNQAIAGVRAAAEETGEAAGGMLAATEELAGQTTILREKSAGFLRAVRAA
ncbi:methyl-accepting chemotaxis protein [Roseomonas xinghualingensis]|uniref:methyl-accepting chemotaxis protein n=1 Tax=Roseomonas xinghualingensis TaxID=2986475 RepID=UPI0021F0B4E4|nr:methyl-accepting chemotaxis protein [Roseomonas sp. SXEYE001]MCV4206456.1 methyl-accepting chemotaxis protein [Roseomonas sp. SXEYE001]